MRIFNFLVWYNTTYLHILSKFYISIIIIIPLITLCRDAEMQSCRLEYNNPYNHTKAFFKHWWTLCRDAALRSCRLEYINPYNHTKGVFFNIDEHDAEMRRCSLADLNISILIIYQGFFLSILMNMMRRCSLADLNISILMIIPSFFFQHW